MGDQPYHATYNAIQRWISYVTNQIYETHKFLEERFVNIS